MQKNYSRASFCFKTSIVLLALVSWGGCSKNEAVTPELSDHPEIYWWSPQDSSDINFGDYLTKVIVERIIGRPVTYKPLESSMPQCLFGGSVLHFARNDYIVWGAGFRDCPLEENRFSVLDVRAVRGPRSREFLLKKNIKCPKIYGDPVLLLPRLFPELKRETPIYDYIIIPNIGEMESFASYKNVVLPTSPWEEIVQKILRSRLVISGSLHGLIVAEAFGVPARLLKMTWTEPLLKYSDYYESTDRPDFKYATSVQQALELGGEEPGFIDSTPLLESFPWDYFIAGGKG